METTQGNHIGYEEVKVSQTNNGYVVYKYKSGFGWSSQQIDRNGVAVTFANTAAPCSSSIPSYPSAPAEHNFTRGNLESETFYNQSGTILKARQYNDTYVNNPVTAFGRLEYGPLFGGTAYAKTFYSLKTARKVSSTITELTYQTGGGFTSTLTQQFFESPYHNQPTKIITTDSRGETIEKRIKYSFEYRVPLFENVQNCNTASGVAGSYDFLTFVDNVYLSSYQAAFMSCNAVSCHNNLNTQFHNATFPKRKSYVDCRRTNYTNPVNTYQTNHEVAKINAGPELKTILWMQDNNMHLPIETTEWKQGNLISATYSIYNNNRNDVFGIYPEKIQRINITTPTAAFTPSFVAADNINITKDSRYKDEAFSDFNRGNIISIIGKDGVPTSYEWRYNQKLPVVEVVNAVNNIKEQSATGIVTKTLSFQLSGSIQSASITETFNQTRIGNITIILSQGPNNATMTGNITLSGPQNQSAYLCFAGISALSCSTTPSAITWSNMPVGIYTITYSVSVTYQNYTVPFTYTPSYAYQGGSVTEAGLKEFFFDGFEESIGSGVVTGPARTGNRYYNTNYVNSFTKPNARNYTIQWWNYSNSKWNFNSSSYNNGMTLNGPVDDIRIFPADAYMTTYTYDVVKGITSQTDANGRTIYYEYDAFNRLSIVRDQDNNILKKICYNYAGQPENCMTCYTTAADWQNTATAVRCQKNASNQNTGYQEQEQKDINPCSPTYNSPPRWVVVGYNPTACPLPAGCVTGVNCNGNHRRCVNGVCEIGIMVIDGYSGGGRGGGCRMYYHYEFSDGTWSNQFSSPADPSYCSGSGGGPIQ
ncbi:MAG: RHS repeat protein [Hydrotalea flava]|nr:RHS repeat protein [Hydrotalea flava]